MGLRNAFAQIAVMAFILAGGGLVTRHHVANLERPDQRGAEYLEDSKAGNGSRYRVLQRASDTGGASCEVEVLGRGSARGFMDGFAASVPAHAHGVEAESLTVLAGRLGYFRGGAANDRGVLAPGDTLHIPPGTPHALFNADNTSDVRYVVRHVPCGPLGEAFFESLASLGWSYGSLDRVHPLQVLVLYDAAGAKLTDLYEWLQPIVRRVLVPVARLLGFRPVYPGSASLGAASPGAAGSSEQPHEEL